MNKTGKLSEKKLSRLNFQLLAIVISVVLSFAPVLNCFGLTQTKSPTNWTDNGSTDADDQFSDPLTNLAASDDARECLNDIDKGELCKGYLTGFGFTIPAGATINDITITMEGLWSFTADRDGYKMTIQNHSGDNFTYVDNKVEMTDSETSVDYAGAGIGGAGKIFNLDVASKWTVAEINGANMGIYIEEIKSKFNDATFCFDYIAITVDYDEAVPLPVELIDFTATEDEDQVTFNWSTAAEINNDYFTIEKSIDGKLWEELAVVSGAGNSNVVLHYSYETYDAETSAYYRLKQTDYDGTVTYSETIQVEVEDGTIELNAYPNPTKNVVTVTGEELSDLQVYDVFGKQLDTSALTVRSSSSSVTLDLSAQEGGLYLVKVGTTVVKVYKQ